MKLQLSYQINNSGNSNFITYDFSDSSGRYDMVVDSLSNQFKQNITTHKPVIKLSYNAKKINYSFGSGFGFTSNLQDLTQSKGTKKFY
jgi:hypothetical protein